MNKEELVNKINHALLDKDTIAADTNHPFHDFSIEDMEDTMEDFKELDSKYGDKPSWLISQIVSYLNEKDLLTFDLEEKSDQDDSWLEVILYLEVGVRNKITITKSVIWDGSFYYNCTDFDSFMVQLAETQLEINEAKFFNSFKE